jgi:L-threonylcarbamoyladenylate synthase
MQTSKGARVWRIHEQAGALLEVAQCLRAGGLVAFPTETVYGLGVHAGCPEAVARLFEAKRRPTDNPLIVHVATADAARALVREVHPVETALMQAFWPGPLTLVLSAQAGVVCPAVMAHTQRVGVRVPDHPIARAILEAVGVPIAAPSANVSGRPSPTTAAHVLDDLAEHIDGVVDGGAVPVGIESTVVVVDKGVVTILRHGAVPAERIAAVAPIENAPRPNAPLSPGVRHAHYAPRGTMCVVEGCTERVQQYIQQRLREDRACGYRTAVLAYASCASAYEADIVMCLAPCGRISVAAQSLYASLRACDDARIERVYAEACPRIGLGEALMDRLVRAASHRCVRV